MKKTNSYKIKNLFVLLFIVLFTGCIGPLVEIVKVPPDIQKKLIDEIEISDINTLNRSHYKIIQPITATSCKNLITDKAPSVEDAINQLRYKAFKLGANAIINLNCYTEGTNYSKNCWSSVTCDGIAIKIDKNFNKNNNGSNISSGTGFFIHKNGFLLTNSHIISNHKNVYAYINNNKYQAKLIAEDIVNDIALLKIDYSAKPIPLQFINNSKIGTEITVIGYPMIGIQGNEIKATFGQINSVSGFSGDLRMFQISAPIQPGNSGSPLINEYGEVIGIVTSTLNQIEVLKSTGSLSQNVNYAIKIFYAQPLLNQGQVDIEIIKDRQQQTKTQLIENIAECVVLIVAE